MRANGADVVERGGAMTLSAMAQNAVTNPFDTARAVAARPGNAVADQGVEREIASVKAMMVIAKQFPRDERGAMDRILNACQRAPLAEKAMYSYAKGGTEITGPSIRLAEVIAQHWGNIESGVRELEQSNGESKVEAYAWDTETNRRVSRVFHVSHWRYKKDGTGYRLTDPREIYEMVANQGARRLRACILEIIPSDVTEAAVEQCNKTLSAKIEVTPERVQAMLEKFAALGVEKAQIEARIQRRIEALQPGQLVALGKIYNSIEAGMSAPVEWFDPLPEDEGKGKAGAKPPSTSKEKLKAAAGVTAAPATAAQPVAAAIDEAKPRVPLEEYERLGRQAAIDGLSRTDCPPDLDPEERGAWREGFDKAEEEANGGV